MLTLSEKINARFEVTSLAPMILLDGGWGVGKTHFINNDYIPSASQSCILISILGLETLQQFHEKLIGQYFSSIEPKRISEITKVSKSLLSSFGRLTRTSQVIDAVSGIVKQSILIQLSDITIIIDDLERVNDCALKSLILGDIYDMCNGERNIRALVVMNKSDSDIAHTLLEKVFCWHFKFELTSENAYDIAFGHLKTRTDLKKHLVLCLNKIGTLNLRVLIRLCDGMNEISTLLESIGDEEIDVEASQKNIYERMIYLSFFYYQLGHSVDEILKQLAITPMPNDNDDRHHLYRNRLISKESRAFVEFTLGCLSRSIDESDLKDLQPKSNELLDFIYCKGLSRYTDIEIKENVEKLLDYVFFNDSPSLNVWYSSVNFLAYLRDIGATNHPKLEGIVVEADIRKEVITPVEEKNFRTFSYDKGLSLSIDQLRSFYDHKEKETNIVKLVHDISNMAWKNVDRQVYEFVKINRMPLSINSEEWLTIIKKWSNEDIELFWDFCMAVENEYGLTATFINKNTVMTIVNGLVTFIKELDFGVKKALLQRLQQFLSKLPTLNDETIEI